MTGRGETKGLQRGEREGKEIKGYPFIYCVGKGAGVLLQQYYSELCLEHEDWTEQSLININSSLPPACFSLLL